MGLRNFDDVELTPGMTVRASFTVQPPGRYEDRLTASPLKPAEEWTHTDLRTYVVAEIERRFGRWERNFITEAAIFKRFHKEWGAQGVRMAQYLFDTLDGWWQGDPVTVNRFCKKADLFFAVPLSERMLS